MLGTRWPKEREDRLREMWGAGATFKELALAFGADVRGVQAKVYRMHLPRRYPAARHKSEEFLAFRREGRSTGYIAEKMGAGLSTVQNWVRLAILDGNTKPVVAWSMEADAELIRLWQKGLAPSVIGRQMKRTASAVSARGRKLGMTPNRTYPKARKPAPARDYKADHLRLVARTPRPKVTDTLWDKTETSRPWLERAKGECAFPLGEAGDIHSCCAPVLHNDTYCEHHRIVAGGLRIPGDRGWDRSGMKRAA